MQHGNVRDSAMVQKKGPCNAKHSVAALRGPKTRKFIDIEEKWFKYFEQTQNNGNAVSHKMVQLRACEIALSLNITGNEFKASRV
jgi:hypothetical protein